MHFLPKREVGRLAALGGALKGRPRPHIRGFRPFSSSWIVCDSAAQLTRSKAAGAKEETQDITEMDKLLRVSRMYLHFPFFRVSTVRRS